MRGFLCNPVNNSIPFHHPIIVRRFFFEDIFNGFSFVLAKVENVSVNGAKDHLPGIAHFTFEGAEGDALLLLLDAQGVQCSTGSACSAGVPRPSHVLLAMGMNDKRAKSSLRFSIGTSTTEADIDLVISVIAPVVERARAAGLV